MEHADGKTDESDPIIQSKNGANGVCEVIAKGVYVELRE